MIGGSSQILTSAPSPLTPARSQSGHRPPWRRDGKELFSLSGSKFKAVDVKTAGTSFEASIPKDLFEGEIDTTGRRNSYVATSDGQRFLFVTTPVSLDTIPFIVVQNWQSALKH